MKKSLIAILLLVTLLFTSCSTMVRIETDVPGATVKINNQKVGTTPVVKNLSDAIWQEYHIEISKDGYDTVRTKLDKEIKVGQLIGGLFVWPILFWSYGPVAYQNFELEEK